MSGAHGKEGRRYFIWALAVLEQPSTLVWSLTLTFLFFSTEVPEFARTAWWGQAKKWYRHGEGPAKDCAEKARIFFWTVPTSSPFIAWNQQGRSNSKQFDLAFQCMSTGDDELQRDLEEKAIWIVWHQALLGCWKLGGGWHQSHVGSRAKGSNAGKAVFSLRSGYILLPHFCTVKHLRGFWLCGVFVLSSKADDDIMQALKHYTTCIQARNELGSKLVLSYESLLWNLLSRNESLCSDSCTCIEGKTILIRISLQSKGAGTWSCKWQVLSAVRRLFGPSTKTDREKATFNDSSARYTVTDHPSQCTCFTFAKGEHVNVRMKVLLKLSGYHIWWFCRPLTISQC